MDCGYNESWSCKQGDSYRSDKKGIAEAITEKFLLMVTML